MKTIDEFKTDFGKQLKEAKRRTNLTDEAIADALQNDYGITLTSKQINNHLNGKSLPSLYTLYAYCEIFKISPNTLMFNDSDTEDQPSFRSNRATVPQVLDALVLLLETFEDALDFGTFAAPQTIIDIYGDSYEDLPKGAEPPSQFPSTMHNLTSIQIKSVDLSALLQKWKRTSQILKSDGSDLTETEREMVKDTFFYKEVRNYKKEFDTIYQGCFANSKLNPVFIKDKYESMPLCFDDDIFTGFMSELSANWHYEEYFGQDVEEPNRFRNEFLSKVGCSSKSLDAAIERGNLSPVADFLDYGYFDDELPF